MSVEERASAAERVLAARERYVARGVCDARPRRRARGGSARLGRRRPRVPRLRRRDRLPEPRPRPVRRGGRDPRAGRPLPPPVLHGRDVRALYRGMPPARRALACGDVPSRDEVDPRQLRGRGDRERGQDRPRRDGPGRRRRLRPRLPRTHEPDDGDDGEARLQAGLRPARDRRLPRRRAVPVPRRLDRGRARQPRAPLPAGRRPEVGRLHRARAGAGRGRLHPDAAGVRAGAAPHLRRARDRLRRRRGAVGLRPHRARCGRSSSSAWSPTCSSRGRRSAAACRSPRLPGARS